MKEIEMVDLKSQYKNIKNEIDSAIGEVIDSCRFVKGEVVSDFERQLAQYLGVKHVIAVGSGTDAIQIALQSLDLQPGDEIITPTFSFIAAAEVIAFLGYKPVFVDVDYNTMNMATDKIEELITPKTKVILPVHLFGQNADMGKISALAHKYNLKIVEDACQSMGSEYISSDGLHIKSGTMGDFGCTSFFPSKNLGCFGDGGAIFTNDDNLAEKAGMIANHGMKKRYYHDIIGVNSRLDSIQAAILSVKLKHLDEFVAARRKAATLYDVLLKDNDKLSLPETASFTTHSFHQYTLRCKTGRDELKNRLAEAGIPSMIYYPMPIHMQKAFSYLGYKEGNFPVAEKLSKEVLSLPMHTELSEEQQHFIATHCF